MEELKNVAIWAGCHIAFYTLLSWVTKPSWKQPRADGRLLIATRLHAPTSSQLPSTSKLLSFIESCKSYADHVVVCIGCRNSDGFDDIVQQYRSACGHTATILVIEPWGHFTNALNNCITFAQDNAFDLLGFQSFEYRTTAETINLLRTELCENTLVIGPTIEGHTFELGSHTISGCTSPWNTMAIWNVSVLSLTGFPLIGDGVANRRDIGGIEEVSAITLLQCIRPNVLAKLVRIKGPDQSSWNTSFEDAKRTAYHREKMISKDSRAAEQLKILALPTGRVLHLKL